MTSSTIDRIDRFVNHIEIMSIEDLKMVGDQNIEEAIADLDGVCAISVKPDQATAALTEDRISMEADIKIAFKDESQKTIRTIVDGSDEDDIIGIMNVSPISPSRA